MNIPESTLPRVVIVGAGFAGLRLARSLSEGEEFQVVLLDKNNYHQFQPLFYQVATAGLEPSAISFPLRKMFHGKKQVHIRMAMVESIEMENRNIKTDIGNLTYDYLVLAMGADTNYFGNEGIEKNAVPMKSVAEALALRNRLLNNFELALQSDDLEERKSLLTIVVVGGGPTGVEVSGTLAEMKNTVLPKDYPELDFSQMKIYLLEGSPKVLGAMKPVSSEKSEKYLKQLGVEVKTNVRVEGYDGEAVALGGGEKIHTKTVVWAAGIKPNIPHGIPKEAIGRGGRIVVDRYNKMTGTENIFVLGDQALMTEEAYPNGHPQMAQPAIQQGELLAKNLFAIKKGKPLQPYTYDNPGSMATVGRNLAVVDLPKLSFQGFFAWLVWMFVHLMAIVGVKNRFLIFINWFWNYVTYDQSLRLIIKPRDKKTTS